MIQENSENFIEDIHTAEYDKFFLEKKCNAAGLLNIAGRSSESLNGLWNFGIDWYDTCRRARWFKEVVTDPQGIPLPCDWDWESWERILVPSCWNLQKEELRYFEGSGIYTRTFRYRPHEKDERVFLHFEGANYRTTVFLNGNHLGTHDGGSTPFSMEITEEVQELNRLIVTIEAYRRPDRVPMDNTDWFNYGGLYRDVLLLRLPPVFIKDWFLRLVPDGTFSSILLDVEVDRASISKPVPDMEVRLQIMNLGVDVICPLREGRGQLMVRAKPSLWSPEQPFLYNVSLSLISKSSEKKIPDVIDQVQDRVGFREVRVEGQKILLNGNPMFLKGISVHEDHLLLGKTTNEEIIRATIQDLKALHGNYLRLSHYPHDARFARIADEEGVLLWEEIPVYWAIAFTNPDTYADAENQLSELVQRDRNRASVIIWSVGNENADTDSRFSFMARLVEKARVLDGTRPVSAACLINTTKLAIEDRLAEVLDIIGVNEYYGWYDPDFEKLHQILENSNPRKPVILCEFGGGARAGHRGTEEDLFSEDRQEWIYKRQLDLISSCPYIQGMSPWILYDFRCPRRLNRYQELFNRKGLIDSDRKTKKRAFCLLSTFYRDIKK